MEESANFNVNQQFIGGSFQNNLDQENGEIEDAKKTAQFNSEMMELIKTYAMMI